MPKLTGPLFSVEAHKDLAKALTYQRRPGGAAVYGYKKPKVPLTIPQRLQRWDIASAVAYWRSLSDAAKAEWEAKAQGQGQSGYSYMISHYFPVNLDRVLWLPMQEGSGSIVNDRSGHGNTGTIDGAAWQRLPSGLWYLDFDGVNNKVTVPNQPSLQIVGDLTVILWQKIAVSSAIPFCKHRFSEGEFIISSPSHAAWAQGDGANRDDCDPILPTLTSNVWQQIVIVRVTSSKMVYGCLNGVDSIGGFNYTYTVASSAYDVVIGQRPTNVYVCDGGIVLPRVIPRALSPLEVWDLYVREKSLFGV